MKEINITLNKMREIRDKMNIAESLTHLYNVEGIDLQEILNAASTQSVNQWNDVETGLKCARFKDSSVLSFNPSTDELKHWKA